jgi:UDP-3-O-[3-hydroxymyristoyl] glucosamine N-acyltransferase
MRQLHVSEIFETFSKNGILTEMAGQDVQINRAAAADDCRPGDLVFVEEQAYVKLLLEKRASAVVISPKLVAQMGDTRQITTLTSPNVKLARALICQKFFDRDLRETNGPSIHLSAVIHESVELPRNAVIGPCAVVGPRVRLGDHSVLMSNVVVEEDAVIGEHTVLHPGVVVGHGCRIGRNVIIRSGTIIGSEGFGFAQDENRRHHRIPQFGNVVIEDRAVIGANCCIDRGAFHDTRIAAGTIMDNLCHIAHNVEIGEDCILISMTSIAGSTRLGKRVITSGQTGILDHIDVAEDTVLLHRAGVMSDIKKPGMYGGAPIQPLKDYMKNQAVVRHLTDMRATILELKKKVAALESRE